MTAKSNRFPAALGGLVFLTAAVGAALWLYGVATTPVLLIVGTVVILALLGLLHPAFHDAGGTGGEPRRPRKVYRLERRVPVTAGSQSR
jgi:hypothetical protein